MGADLPPAICLIGPTAAGKTGLAVELVQRLPLEIISVDSAMVYRGMSIGTAKPDMKTLADAPHRLIDFLDPAEIYSAAQFRQDALKHMAEITQAGKVPFLVGGTMLYFRALWYGLASLPAADESVRTKIKSEAEQKGWEAMHEKLAGIDPIAATRIHPNDPQRLTRALEVFALTGKALTHLHQAQTAAPKEYQYLNFAILPENRDWLHRRIEQRVDEMLEQGLVDEVKGLFQRGDLNTELPAVKAVNFRQVWDYLDGKIDYNQMRDQAIFATRQLAKRQLTWIRGEKGFNIHTAEYVDINLAVEQIEAFLR